MGARRVEVHREGEARQIDGYAVVGFQVDIGVFTVSVAHDDYLFGCKRNIVFLGFSQNHCAEIVVTGYIAGADAHSQLGYHVLQIIFQFDVPQLTGADLPSCTKQKVKGCKRQNYLNFFHRTSK